jgi:capsular polysaccharide biosynthesis protein
MNLTNALRVIGRHWVLLVLGILIAVLAAFATAFKVETGSLTPRTAAQYQASTQVLVTDSTSVFSSRNPAQAVPQGQTAATARDLSSLTVVYAYLASSDEIQKKVEAQLGKLGTTESITADQRTTQPTSTTNTGTYRLPILEVVGTSPSPSRAERISAAATKAFEAEVAAQQSGAGVDPASRVRFQTIRADKATVADGSNPLLPVIAVGIGVLIAFLAIIFAADNVRSTRRESRKRPAVAPDAAVAPAAAAAWPVADPVLAQAVMTNAERPQYPFAPPSPSRYPEPAGRS